MMKQIILFLYVIIIVRAAYEDIKTMKVNKWTNIIVMSLALLYCKEKFIFYLIEAVIITVPFLVLAIKTNQFGGGDVKFIFANTCILGIEKMYAALIIAFSILSFQYLICRLIDKKRIRNKKVPLLPYLVTGFLFMMS